ncbi:TPA: hypothetical protein I8Y21_006320 [Klebsiella oxytoca]|uniref:Reverse transcriptase domain-containing protein n=1 Tax=Klebsiella oxytoca TaxID=571 RepID=A0AAN5LED9_KLEOX|nr:hypothetical protein [Klebsiella oxytoca]
MHNPALGIEQRLGTRIVNYADDLVICCKGCNARHAMAAIRCLMSKLKLTVNEGKTRLCRHPEEQFDFLGYTFGRQYTTREKRPYIGMRPSKKSRKKVITWGTHLNAAIEPAQQTRVIRSGVEVLSEVMTVWGDRH